MEFADIVIVNAKVMTMDPDAPTADVVAIKGKRILGVGNFDPATLIGPETQVIDADGNTVLPGFNDSHVHLFGGSGELGCLNLSSVEGPDNFRTAVRAESEKNPDARLVYAVCADYHALGPDVQVDRHALDAIIERPFAMMAADHHTVWANTKALELAGILHGAETDPGAEIVMGPDGLANGVLLETSAFQAVVALTELGGRDFVGYVTGDDPVPAPTLEEREKDKAALRAGLKHCAQYGITSLHNMDGNIYQMELLQELERDGTLLCRVQVPVHLRNTHELSKLGEAKVMQDRFGSDMLSCGRVKMFMDGVIDSYTALMVEPYPDRPDTFGDEVFTAEAFNKAAVKADSMDLQISVHCCGDGAVQRTLDGYEIAIAENGRRDSRHRIEHIETITDADIPRFAELGVIASMQPLHSPQGGLFPPMPEGVIFSDRQIRNGYPWQTLRDAGATVIFNTDWPVVPLSPMMTISGAVFTQSLGPRWTNQQQSLADTLRSYTWGGAYAEFAEDKKGQLKSGMLADIVVLSEDISNPTVELLEQTVALATICNGTFTHVVEQDA